MITQNSENEQFEKSIDIAMKELKISQLLRAANIRKAGISAFDIFSTLLTVIFLKCTLFQLLNSRSKSDYASKIPIIGFLTISHSTGLNSFSCCPNVLSLALQS